MRPTPAHLSNRLVPVVNPWDARQRPTVRPGARKYRSHPR